MAPPHEILTLLTSYHETAGFELTRGIAECRVALDGFAGNTRTSDLNLYGKRDHAKLVVCVEAKADEYFGQTIASALAKAATKTRSRVAQRIQILSQEVFGHLPDSELGRLRYQLLFATAATAIATAGFGADLGVLAVLEFRSPHVSMLKLQRNASDLDAFVAAVPGWAGRTLVGGELLPPVSLPGGGRIRVGTRITIGKVTTTLE